MTRLALVFVVCAALGCSSDPSPTAPSPSPGSMTGPWTGAATDAVNGSGTLHLDLTELSVDATRSLLGGTWRAEFAAPASPLSGTIAGLRVGTTVQVVLQPAAPPPCPPGPFAGAIGTFSAVSLAIDGDTIRGAYSYAACHGTVSGTLAVRRQ